MITILKAEYYALCAVNHQIPFRDIQYRGLLSVASILSYGHNYYCILNAFNSAVVKLRILYTRHCGMHRNIGH